MSWFSVTYRTRDPQELERILVWLQQKTGSLYAHYVKAEVDYSVTEENYYVVYEINVPKKYIKKHDADLVLAHIARGS